MNTEVVATCLDRGKSIVMASPTIFPPSSWLLGLLAIPLVHDVSGNATQHPHHHLVA